MTRTLMEGAKVIGDPEEERERRLDAGEFASSGLCDPRRGFARPARRLPILDMPLDVDDELLLAEASKYTREEVIESGSQYATWWWLRARDWSSPDARANQILDALETIWNVSSN